MPILCQACGKSCEPFKSGEVLVCKDCHNRYQNKKSKKTRYHKIAKKYDIPVLIVIKIHMDIYDNCLNSREQYQIIETLLTELEG